MTNQPEPESPATPDDGHPMPPSEAEIREAREQAARRPDPRLLAYAATFAYIAQLPDETAYLNSVARNALIWRAVHAALDAANVGRCISSHCVEGDHVLDLDQTTPGAPHA